MRYILYKCQVQIAGLEAGLVNLLLKLIALDTRYVSLFRLTKIIHSCKILKLWVLSLWVHILHCKTPPPHPI